MRRTLALVVPTALPVVAEGGVALPAAGRPLAVRFDKGNWLVAETRMKRSLDELLYVLDHGELAARLRAARQIADDFPRRSEGVAPLSALLADPSAHGGLRQEAALGLKRAGRESGVDA